jgi:hypothetical protein
MEVLGNKVINKVLDIFFGKIIKVFKEILMKIKKMDMEFIIGIKIIGIM